MIPTTPDATIRNPFRRQMQRDGFAEMVHNWRTHSSLLFNPDGTRCMGNGFASSFWKGYDGAVCGFGGLNNYSDRASREIIAYIYFRAGQECRKAATREGRVDPPPKSAADRFKPSAQRTGQG